VTARAYEDERAGGSKFTMCSEPLPSSHTGFIPHGIHRRQEAMVGYVEAMADDVGGWDT